MLQSEHPDRPSQEEHSVPRVLNPLVRAVGGEAVFTDLPAHALKDRLFSNEGHSGSEGDVNHGLAVVPFALDCAFFELTWLGSVDVIDTCTAYE